MLQLRLREKWKLFLNRYFSEPGQNAPLPRFGPDTVCRYRVTFSGTVQGVGFRWEVYHLAQRMKLTGYVENLPCGDVLAELQGPENRILYLIAFMESLKRITVEKKVVEPLPLCPVETEFEIR